MLKKLSFGPNKRYKNVLFFLLQAPTHHSLKFNLRFLYRAKAQSFSLKNCVWDFPFSIWFHFY